MKTKCSYLTAACLALAGVATLNTTARADGTPGSSAVSQQGFDNQSYYSLGDLFLSVGDPADGSNLAYGVDLGNITKFTKTASLDLGNFSADLNSMYGSYGATAGDGLTSQAQWTVYGTVGTSAGAGFVAGSSFITATDPFEPSQYSAASNVGGLNNLRSTLEEIGSYPGATDVWGQAPHSIITGSTSDNLRFQGNISGPQLYPVNISENIADLSSSMDLLTITGGGGITHNHITNASIVSDMGTFGFDSSGDLTFTGINAEAAPEPSTWALMTGGFAILFVMLRRRKLSMGV